MDHANSVVAAIVLIMAIVSMYATTMYSLTVLLRVVDLDDEAGGGSSLFRLFVSEMWYDTWNVGMGFLPMWVTCFYVFLWMWIGIMNGG